MEPAKRAPRSDGQRNRQLILEAAKRAFATDGVDATLNAIARDAGVGIATLFRHYPTREALIEASYSESIEYLCGTAATLLESNDAMTATREWMAGYLDYMSLRRGMADTIRALAGADVDSRVYTVERLEAAVELLLAAGRAEGVFRGDVPAGDVLVALGGITLMAGRPAQRDQADRLVELLLAGLRTDRAKRS
jgi:AcrR family transcriptional regulator